MPRKRAATSESRGTSGFRSPVQVKRSDRSVQRSADDDEAAGGEGDVGDAAGVLGEGDEAEAAVAVPHLHLEERRRKRAFALFRRKGNVPLRLVFSSLCRRLLPLRCAVRQASTPAPPCC